MPRAFPEEEGDLLSSSSPSIFSFLSYKYVASRMQERSSNGAYVPNNSNSSAGGRHAHSAIA